MIEVSIQTIARDHAAQNQRWDACATHASAFDAHSPERQHVEPEETLGKLWRSVEQMADALIIMDRSGIMEYLNPAFEALTGYSRQEAIGQTLRNAEVRTAGGRPLR